MEIMRFIKKVVRKCLILRTENIWEFLITAKMPLGKLRNMIQRRMAAIIVAMNVTLLNL
jgi:hypothetical protein